MPAGRCMPNDAQDACLVPGSEASESQMRPLRGQPRLNDAHDAHLVAVACPARAQMMLMMQAWWAIPWPARPSQSPNNADDDARLVGRSVAIGHSVAQQGQMMLMMWALWATPWPAKAT